MCPPPTAFFCCCEGSLRGETRAPPKSPPPPAKLSSVESGGLRGGVFFGWELDPEPPFTNDQLNPGPRSLKIPKVFQAFLDAVRWGAISQSDDRALHSPFRSG